MVSPQTLEIKKWRLTDFTVVNGCTVTQPEKKILCGLGSVIINIDGIRCWVNFGLPQSYIHFFAAPFFQVLSYDEVSAPFLMWERRIVLNIYVYVNSLTYRTSFLWRKEALLGSTRFLMGLAFKASDQVLISFHLLLYLSSYEDLDNFPELLIR